jgi:type IV pilus assembly protein PilE
VNKKVGFTLIEILITVVIIGVLASVSITRYSSVLERSRGAEATEVLLKSYAGYRRLMIDSEIVNSSVPLTWTRLGMSDPNTPANRFFNYTILPNVNNPTSVLANTTRTGGGWLQVDLNTGQITKSNIY